MKFASYLNETLSRRSRPTGTEDKFDDLFYRGIAKDLMIDAHKWDADPTNIDDREIKRFAKKMGVKYKYLKQTYDNMKNEWEDIKRQEYR